MGSLFEIGGLVSGIDTGSLIDGILRIQERPILQAEAKQDEISAAAAAVAAVGTRVSDLKSILTSLKLRSNVNKKSIIQSQPVSSTGLLTATATSDAANGTHIVTIKNLATATKVQSSGFVGLGVTATADATGTTVGASGSGLSSAVTAGTFKLTGPSGNATITVTAGDSLNTIVGNINAATGTTGITATLVNDSEARPNLIQLSVGSGTITVGSGADTSNFLDATNLKGANQSGLTLTSTHNIGVTQVTANLEDARFKTALTGTSGEFKINGVSFTYSNSSDSINDLISRINSSTAGVTASYDSVTDRVVLTAKDTGAQSIELQDVTENFLAASGVLSATQTLGENSLFSIDTVNGGADISRASNVITDVIAGVTLTFKQEDTVNPITVTVAQDASAAATLVQDAVTAVNSLLDYISSKTAYDPDTETASILLGDTGINGIATQVRKIFLGNGEGLTGEFKSLQDIGITTGAAGAAAGTANTLQVDVLKLTDALNDNPDAVADLLGLRDTAAVLNGGGIGNISSVSGSPTVRQRAGTYTLTIDSITGDPSTDPQTATLTFDPSDGGPDIVTTQSVTPGEANVDLIPGMTINMGGTLAVGSDSVDVTVPVRGVAQILDDYLEGVLGPDGLFDVRADSAVDRIDDLEDRIVNMEARLLETRSRLVLQFSRLEATLAQLQGQQNFLSAQLATSSGLGVSGGIGSS